MRSRSVKRSVQERIYAKLRDKYLRDHPECEVKGCGCPADDLHHRAGWCGDLLIDVTKFMAVCRPHHNYIESHPLEAKEKGYSV